MVEPTVDSVWTNPVVGIDYPRDLAEFRAWFADDEACRDYLDWLRWPTGFICPHCHATTAGVDEIGRYRCHGCRRRVSVTSATIFDRARIPLTVWFETAWLLTTGKSGISAAGLYRVLPVHSYPTVWAMVARYRSVMGSASSPRLSGRVEVDETFFGGPRSGKAGRGALGKTLVAGAIEITETGWGRARLAVIEDASATSLAKFVGATIAPGSTVITDAWSAYPAALDEYVHEPVNVKASGSPAHESLPAVHRLFAQVKRMTEGTYQGAGSREHLGEYLDEFVFRFNRRRSRYRGLVFMRLLQRSVVGDPVTFRRLVRRSVSKTTPPPMVSGRRSRPGSLVTPSQSRPWRRR